MLPYRAHEKKKWRRWLPCGITCTSTSFFTKDTHFLTFFLLAEQKEELCRFQTMVEPFPWLLREKRSDFEVEGKSTVVEVLTKVICYTYTRANILAYAPPGPHPPTYRTGVKVHTITPELYFFVSTSLIQVLKKSLAWPGGVCQSCYVSFAWCHAAGARPNKQ